MKESAYIALQTGHPSLWWGLPGIGKTRHIEAMATAIKHWLETVIASIRDPSDFSGLPFLNDGGVRLAPPQWALNLVNSPRGILFFDELTTAPPACQAGLLRVVHDLVVGELPLPKTTRVIAAANPPEQAAGGFELAPPMANRFWHFDVEVNANQWVSGMLSGFPDPTIRILPDDWKNHVPEQRALGAAFIRSRPDMLHVLPKTEAEAGKAWPSHRTWDMLCNMMAAHRAYRGSDESRIELARGCVGTGAANEYVSYVENLDLPDPQWLLQNPSKFEVPPRGDQQFAVLAGVAAATVADLTDHNWKAAWEIMAIAAEKGYTDVAAGAVRTLADKFSTEMYLPEKELEPFIDVLDKAQITGFKN